MQMSSDCFSEWLTPSLAGMNRQCWGVLVQCNIGRNRGAAEQ